MAMFDLKDSEDIHIDNAKTNSETLLKGQGLRKLVVKNSIAGAGLATKLGVKVITLRIIVCIVTLIGFPLLVAYLAWKFGWTG